MGSYSKQVTDAGDHMQVLPAFDITVPKNGYAYVYVSNESTQQAVYFDNLAVTHTRHFRGNALLCLWIKDLGYFGPDISKIIGTGKVSGIGPIGLYT